MRRDIVRGLIELITNSDDAYAAVGTCRPGQPGRIVIEVEHRRNQASRVIVRDRAVGMRRQTMLERLATLGGRTSGFERGEDRRGNLGRGAKDLAAFGDTTFTSVCDGFINRMVLHPDGTYEINRREGRVREEEREELGIKHSGTVVEVEVRRNVARVPRHQNLKEKLGTHYQLRDILNDPLRKVELVNLNRREETDPLVYRYPEVEEVFSGRVDIPGYDGASADLVIWRHPTRCDEGAENPGRPTGVIIKGRRAIYENTLFGFEGNANAGWFSGKLTCPFIDDLARGYDDAQGGQADLFSPNNPMPIISRQRDGLEREHPFVHELHAVAEGILGKFVAREAERVRRESTQAESAGTRRALARLAREVGRLFDDEMKEIEADEPPGDGRGMPPLLAVAPDQAYAYIGEDRTLSVHARADGVEVGDRVSVELEPQGVIELLSDDVELKPHARREDVLIGQLRFRPLLEGEAVIITCQLSGRTASAYVEVRDEREVTTEDIELPESLEFERGQYRIGFQRKKTLRIVAPVDIVAEHGEDVRVESSKPEEVVVRGGTATLNFDDTLDHYVGTVTVEARALHATATLTATLGPVTATSTVAVTREEGGPSFVVRLDSGDWGLNRFVLETETSDVGHDVQVIKIAARHAALRPYLGDEYEGQGSYVCRTIFAEVVADAVARHVVRKLYVLRQGVEMFDAERLYREHTKRVAKFLPSCYRACIGDPVRARQMGSDEASLVDPAAAG